MEFFRLFFRLLVPVSLDCQHMNHTGAFIIFCLTKRFLKAFQVMTVNRPEILETERLKKTKVLVPHHHGFQHSLGVVNRLVYHFSDDGYPGNFAYAFFRALVSGTDYTTEYSGNTDAGQASITVTGKGNYKDSVSASFKIKPKTLTAPMLTKKAADVTYTGEEQKPSVEMKDGSTALQEGKDYTISYRNHMNAGTAAYTITGKGNYQGSVEGQFTISARAITGVVIESIPEQTFTGSAITPLPVVKDGSKTLVNGTDYDVSYKDNVNAGTAKVNDQNMGRRLRAAAFFRREDQ